MERRTRREVRPMRTEFSTRMDEHNNPSIEGYFVVFGSTYDIAPGMSESIDPNAFQNTLDGDIRALTNHDTTLVLGRTKANTLQLKADSYGLWGHIDINPNDVDAMNSWERVNRGDIDQASFGFEIRSEDTDIREDGSVHWTIKDVELFEVSICTFPAYKETNISARAAERDAIRAREMDAWRETQKRRLTHGS